MSSTDRGAPAPKDTKASLSITALYTSATWSWGGLRGADLLASDDARAVFRVTNLALAAARPFQRDARSLRHSLLHRHTMIDHLALESGAKSILELAAGLSRRGVALTEDPSLQYAEVDLPAVIAHKRKLLERTDRGRDALARPNLSLIEGDVLDLDLSQIPTGAGPLFVIAEGLFMYLTPEQQRSTWQKIRSLFSGRTGTLVFDLVPASEEPPPGLPGRALGWLMRRFTGGRGFERDSRSRQDIEAALRASGFDDVQLLEPASVARSWELPFPEVPTRQLLFVARAA